MGPQFTAALACQRLTLRCVVKLLTKRPCFWLSLLCTRSTLISLVFSCWSFNNPMLHHGREYCWHYTGVAPGTGSPAYPVVEKLRAHFLQGVMWAGIALATIFTIIKTTIRLYILKRLFIDDVLVYIALSILIVLGVLYTLVNDTIFEIILVGMGEMPATPAFFGRMTFFLKVQFAIIVLFWTALWAVKFSFLMYYKKLFIGLPGNMQKCWWAVSTFALLAYLGCWITQLTSCEPMSTYFNGQCTTPRDIYVSNLSLYYATSVDIICDVMSKPAQSMANVPITDCL